MTTRTVTQKKNLRDVISKVKAKAHKLNRLGRFYSQDYKVYGKETITPAEAKYLLAEHNNNTGIDATNRRLDERVVAFLCRELENKEWFHEAAIVALDTKGNMINGQHTVAAIAAFGKDVEVNLIVGCRTETIGKLDVGRKRSVPMRIKLAKKFGKGLANTQVTFFVKQAQTILRATIYPNGNTVPQYKLAERVNGYNDSFVVDCFKNNKKALVWLLGNKPLPKHRSVFKHGILAGIAMYFKNNEAKAKDFFEQLVNPPDKKKKGESNAPAMLHNLVQEIVTAKKKGKPVDMGVFHARGTDELRFWYIAAQKTLQAFAENKDVRNLHAQVKKEVQ